MTLITNNVDIIVLIITLIAVAVYVFKKGKAGLYSAALYLVSVAEDEWGSSTGKIKFAEVLSTIKKQYPIISLFIREDEIKEIIENALLDMKAVLARKQAEESTDSIKPLDIELMTGNKE